MKALCIFLLCFFHLIALTNPSRPPKALVIWNVGQGSWATKITAEKCRHFDVGGEFAPLSRIFKLCQWQKQEVYLSHWDWDHISHLNRFKKLMRALCLEAPPQPTEEKKRKKNLWILQWTKNILSCDEKLRPHFSPLASQAKKLSSNEQSLIYIDHQTLFPGDSSRHMEKLWIANLPIKEVRVLVLGHHGSRTSTSKDLLNKLKYLKMAVASARYRRYGHPHPKVIEQLRAKKIPILLTEKWGHLWFLSE